MSRISNLYRVQDIDQKIEANQKRLSEIQRKLEDNEQLKKLRARAEQIDGELAKARISLKYAEQEVTLQRQKIAGSEHKLYSGTVKNPKELEDIQGETTALKRHLTTLEDIQLEAMFGVEEIEKKDLEASENVEREEIRIASSQKSLFREKETLELELEKLLAEHEAAFAVTDRTDIETYLSLKERLGSMVISRVSDGSCSICGMVVAASTLQSVRAGSEIHRCNQCSRILYAG